MTSKPLVLFDMDGVILDSASAIVASLRFALHSIGADDFSEPDLRMLIGPPLHLMVKELIPDYSPADKEQFMLNYRSHNNQHGPDLTNIFRGVPDVLQSLQVDFDLVIATSKLESAAKNLLSRKNLSTNFKSIYGTLQGFDDTKTNVIQRAIANRPSSQVVAMIGDRIHDIDGAKMNGIRSVGVQWGYALPGELEKANPTAIADSPASLKEILKSFS